MYIWVKYSLKYILRVVSLIHMIITSIDKCFSGKRVLSHITLPVGFTQQKYSTKSDQLKVHEAFEF